MGGRRLIYLLMILAVGLPIVFGISQKPSRLVSAERMYDVVEQVRVQPGEVAMVWFDFGPNTIAENEPQAQVLIEHLFRRRIPVVLLSQYQQAERFLTKIPNEVAKRLEAEMPGQQWRYGEAWVNAGFRPGGAIFIQSMVNATDVSKFLGRDVNGMPISHYPSFSTIGGVERVKLVGEITGLVGVFDNIIQFFQKNEYRPTIVHGCTSITIPEAYIFLDSGQLKGLLEGIAGAAWYSEVLKQHFPSSENKELLVTNTALSAAHIVLIALIVVGNIVPLLGRRRSHG
ncbi:MAG: hypothetical protein RL518_1664 [Pseudomonadota bacterium]